MLKASSLANLNFGWRKETSVWERTELKRTTKWNKNERKRKEGCGTKTREEEEKTSEWISVLVQIFLLWHRMINDHLSVNNSFISRGTRVTLRYTLKFLCRKQPSSPTYTCSNPFNLKSYHSSYFFYLLHYKTCQIYMYYRERNTILCIFWSSMWLKVAELFIF